MLYKQGTTVKYGAHYGEVTYVDQNNPFGQVYCIMWDNGNRTTCTKRYLGTVIEVVDVV